VKNVETRHLMS